MLLDTVLRTLGRRDVLGTLSHRRRASVLAVGLAAVGLTTLAGCGQAVPAPAAGDSGRPATAAVAARLALCAAPGAVSRVQIVVVPPLGQLSSSAKGAHKLIKITITTPVKARTLARAVCALTVMPRGVFHCPANFGGGYQLTFAAGRRHLPAVTVQAGGCETVSGAGPVRRASTGFWATLGRVIGARPIAHSRSR